MTDKEVLQKYIDLVPFLSKILGDGSEVIVHDVSRPKSSMVAISNSLSGRKVGSPMTDLAKAMVEMGLHTEEDYIANYDGNAKDVNFISSTYFIKNNNKLIGMLCINKSISKSRELVGAMLNFFQEHNLSAPEQDSFHENLDTKVEDFVESRVAQTIALSGIAPDRLNAKEKAHIVKKLDENGVLKIKGAIEETAKQLSVSVPTIYRYLKK